MKLVNGLQQSGEQWSNWRSQGIGGSDAAGIMGVSPWVDRSKLLVLKTWPASQKGEKKENTEAMRRGIELEPIARRTYEEQTGLSVTPVCVVHDDYPWMLASLDGLSPDLKFAVEIKCANMEVHQQALNGKVTDYYWPQVQHQLLVTGLGALHFYNYSRARKFSKADSLALVIVEPDLEYQARLLEEEKKFWTEVLERRAKRLYG
jgi:putative phage-type endonuclease